MQQNEFYIHRVERNEVPVDRQKERRDHRKRNQLIRCGAKLTSRRSSVDRARAATKVTAAQQSAAKCWPLKADMSAIMAMLIDAYFLVIRATTVAKVDAVDIAVISVFERRVVATAVTAVWRQGVEYDVNDEQNECQRPKRHQR